MSLCRQLDEHTADRQAWATPPALFAELHREYSFTVDAAAGAENAKLPRFFDRRTDGLSQDWSTERIWCNPPYGSIAPWVERAATAELAALLLPARTDTSWFGVALATASQIDFFSGRIQFVAPAGVAGSSNAEGSLLVVFARASSGLAVGLRDAETGKRIGQVAPVQLTIETRGHR